MQKHQNITPSQFTHKREYLSKTPVINQSLKHAEISNNKFNNILIKEIFQIFLHIYPYFLHKIIYNRAPL